MPSILRAALAALILLTLPAIAAAQQPGTMKIAVIDVGRILDESKAGKETLDKLRNLREQKEAEGRVLQQEAQELRDRLAEGQLSLSEDKLDELRKQLEDKLYALRRFENDANREIQKTEADSLKKIEAQVMPLIRQVGQESGYTLIFNKFQSGLVFAIDEVDITNQVLKMFDQAGPEGS